MARNCKNKILARARCTQHSLRDCRIELSKIADAFIKVVAVGHPGIGNEVVKTGMDSGAQDYALCRVQRSLGADCAQLCVSGPKPNDGDPGGGIRHTLDAALSPPR